MKNPIPLLSVTLIAFILCSTYLRNLTCPCNANSLTSAATAITGATSLLISDTGVEKDNTLNVNVKPVREFVFYFNYNKKSVNDVETMVEVLSFVQQHNNNNIKILGHADGIGSESFNQALSENRAQFIMEQLVKKGVNQSQITTIGKGETEPIASNESPQGRSQNRRVVVQIFG